MTRPITVGVDGSPESLAAAVWGADEARRRKVPLRLVHAWGTAPCPDPPVDVAESWRRWGREFLREAADAVEAGQPGLDLGADQLPGPPVDVLLQAAEEAELLVLGSRGISRLTGYLIGSVALSVAANTPRPVVLVRSAAGSDTTPGRAVVVGLDLEHSCDELLDFAFDAARVRSAGLRVVHAFPPPGPYLVAPGESSAATLPDMIEEHRAALQRATRTWQEKNPDIPAELVVDAGHAASVVLESTRDASLCVIGRLRRPHAVGPRLGAVDHGVLHHAPCPVAVVPHP